MMNNETFNAFLQDKANASTLQTSALFKLNCKGQVYAFTGGPINLFIQRKDSDSRRYFLASFTEDNLFFSLDVYVDDPDFEIIAVPIATSVMYQLAQSEMQHFLQQHPLEQKPFAAHLEYWLESIASNVSIKIKEGNIISLSAEADTQVLDGDVISAKIDDFIWLKLNQGSLLMFADEQYVLDEDTAYYPITSLTWFSVKSSCQLQTMTSLSLIREGLWPQALLKFVTLFSQALSQYIQNKLMQQEQLQQQRTSNEDENLDLAFKELNDVFVTESLVSIIGQARDPLQQALMLIGHFMKIEFVFPHRTIGDEGALKSIDERLDIICQASQIQRRKIKLEDKWWHRNQGSMLAFLAADEKPVSIIRMREYKIIDSERNEELSEPIAKDIMPMAYMFYRHFDSKLNSGKQALQFFFKNYYKELKQIVPIGILGVLFALFPPIATNYLFANAIPQSNKSLIVYLIVGLFFSAIGLALFYFLYGLVYLKLQGLATHLIQTSFCDRLLKLSPRFFRRYTVGNLFSRVFAIEDIRVKLSGQGASLVMMLFFVVLYALLMFVFAPKLALLALFFAAIGMLITLLCCRAKIALLKQTLEIDANLRGTVMEMVQGLEKIRVAGVDKSAYAHWASSFAGNNALQLKIQSLQNFSTLSSTILPVISIAAIYFTILEWIPEDTLSLAHFLAFNIAFGSFCLAIYPLNNLLMHMVDVIPLWDRSRVILAEPLETVERRLYPGKLSGDIQINDLVFAYDSTRAAVINHISMNIKQREYIGIVGKTGCGKSTLIRLLLGFEKPSSGVIFYDGVDLASLDLQALRRQLGVVMQAGTCMGGSLYEILSSGGSYTQEEFDKALALSGFDADLAQLPMGYNTMLPANATTLSSGQRQRLFMASALIGNPSILIFDEATSALDSQSQDKVIHQLEKLNVTRIAIAQRLSTIRNADRIYVLDKGRVAQEGSFDQLAGQSGLFAEMLAKQTRV